MCAIRNREKTTFTKKSNPRDFQIEGRLLPYFNFGAGDLHPNLANDFLAVSDSPRRAEDA
jgi:hypothetical protein